MSEVTDIWGYIEGHGDEIRELTRRIHALENRVKPLEPGMYASSVTDPLDLITWVQYRAAFRIATMALGEIALGDPADPAQVAADAMQAIRAEVRRFNDTEPSWEPEARS